jgi:hypothetical protein
MFKQMFDFTFSKLPLILVLVNFSNLNKTSNEVMSPNFHILNFHFDSKQKNPDKVYFGIASFLFTTTLIKIGNCVGTNVVKQFRH